MKISPAESIDLGEILALQKLAFKSQAILYNDCNLPPMKQTLEEIKHEFPKKIFLKAEVSGKIVGSVRADINEKVCHIEKLATHPDYQKQGIASSLMAELEKKAGNIYLFKLFTGFKSVDTIRLYEKLGYKDVGRSMLNKTIELIHMEKQIKEL